MPGNPNPGAGFPGDGDLTLVPFAPPIQPRALWFDPVSRDFLMDSNGRYLDLHPVDAAVLSQLLFEFGKIPAVPTMGQSYRQVESAFADDVLADVQARTRVALKDIVSRGDITIDNVAIDTRPTGALFVQVDYFNERLLPRSTKSASAPLA